MLHINEGTARDLSRSLKLEWLETNGLGGYAMGTVAGANTRRYHGLLCAAAHPPVDRRMLLSKLEERVRTDGEDHELSCNLYGDVVHPRGHELLMGFRQDPWPIWTYQAGCAVIEKAVVMPHGRNATIVRYTCLDSDRPVTLSAQLLVAWRDHHHLRRAEVDLDLSVAPFHGGVILTRPGEPPLVVETSEASYWPATQWYYQFTYPQERARGLDWVEDLYNPGEITWTLRSGHCVTLVASWGEPLGMDPEEALARERERREALVSGAPEGDQVARILLRAADQFVVQRGDESAPAAAESAPAALSIIAGYPWFGDWGRDTMIALPGLLLATGRAPETRRVLLTYADAMQDGLIPNLFTEAGAGAAYNTVDATLWLFVAAWRYFEATGDLALFAEGLFERMKQALAAHMHGTRYHIRMEEDGLISAGDETTQLTWMDAKVGDWVVTPRHGKAVEINALWYSALRTAEFFAQKLGQDATPFRLLADRVRESFVRVFWSGELGYLYDCVRGEERDGSLRPNQVIALALPHRALSAQQEQSVLRAVAEKLLTPFGLRTLSPDDPRYRGWYGGDAWSRDGAYHQGTVWPWLLQPYACAWLRAAGDSAEARAGLRQLLEPLVGHLQTAGLGSVSEIFDGDEPHPPNGCPAQAWSVAALLQMWRQVGGEGGDEPQL